MMKPLLLPVLLILLLIRPSSQAADWPQLLGPDRNGTSNEGPLRSTFDPEPEIDWKHKVGAGLAGPAIADAKVVIFHRVGDLATVDALDAESGKPLWQFTYKTDYRDNFGFDPGPRATPTIADGRVFTYGAEGMLHCLQLDDGKKLWATDTVKTYGSAKGFFGRASAPTVFGDTVILQLDGIVGLDTKTGALKWKATEQAAGYASPALVEIGGQSYTLHLTRSGFVCLDPSNGNVVLEKPFRAKINASVNAATPILIGADEVFLSACYDLGAALWKIDPAKRTIRPTWARGGVLDAHYATPVPAGGKLYGFHGRQESGQELRCIDPIDGTIHWKSPMRPGSLIATKDQLIILTEKGELILAPTSPDGFKPTGRGQILGATTRAIPALADGHLYARDGKNLVRVDLSTP
jgi:outer membrane protein assembly factor BamB